jgi:hypothetical protein
MYAVKYIEPGRNNNLLYPDDDIKAISELQRCCLPEAIYYLSPATKNFEYEELKIIGQFNDKEIKSRHIG